MDIRDLAETWRKLKKTDAAMKGEDLDALREMPHEELCLLTWDALNALELLDDEGYDYLFSMCDHHIEGAGNHQCMWVIAQSDKDGGFNKWSKAVGGRVFGKPDMNGDALLYERWSDAKKAYNEQYVDSPHLQVAMKIYPVVVTAGREPRITKPGDER